VAPQAEVCAVVMDAGVAATVTDVIVKGAAVTAMFAEPVTFLNRAWVEWAVQVPVPVPVPEGVKTPPEEMAPPVAVQVTAVL
jgi:hypothetical protein